ncbi:MAG: hypothetical protein GOMPHAMPRED_002869 [Gomphillus americanus]|uniref:Uncharacterized protein n=1 Tax=Gomphillus americanus TaxID=1940652 RepID=A0A8H3EFB6_9LECA|nr:MAG: hypothetical protein GOMPHAMPRED_002869 [Gomphillus americanus]
MANTTAAADALIQAMLDGPAAPAPSGITSNFVDPPSNGVAGLIAALISLGIATIMLVIRIFTKLYIIKAWNIEDCMGSFLGYVA